MDLRRLTTKGIRSKMNTVERKMGSQNQEEEAEVIGHLEEGA